MQMFMDESLTSKLEVVVGAFNQQLRQQGITVVNEWALGQAKEAGAVQPGGESPRRQLLIQGFDGRSRLLRQFSPSLWLPLSVHKVLLTVIGLVRFIKAQAACLVKIGQACVDRRRVWPSFSRLRCFDQGWFASPRCCVLVQGVVG
jgi:hypothetical protein